MACINFVKKIAMCTGQYYWNYFLFPWVYRLLTYSFIMEHDECMANLVIITVAQVRITPATNPPTNRPHNTSTPMEFFTRSRGHVSNDSMQTSWKFDEDTRYGQVFDENRSVYCTPSTIRTGGLDDIVCSISKSIMVLAVIFPSSSEYVKIPSTDKKIPEGLHWNAVMSTVGDSGHKQSLWNRSFISSKRPALVALSCNYNIMNVMHNQIVISLHEFLINPRHMHKGYSSRFVLACVCVCWCVRVFVSLCLLLCCH